MAADSAQIADMRGLPIKDLILSPILAASDGGTALAKSTLNFGNQIGFDTDKDGNTTTRCISVDIERPVKGDDDEIKMVSQTIKTPVLSLVQIPNVGITDVNVHFDMQIAAHTDNTSTKGATEVDGSTTEVHASAGGKLFGVQFDVGGSHNNTHTGTVTSSSTHTRTTDFSSRYTIDCTAKNLGSAEGMGRLTQMLSEQINVIDASAPAPSGGK